MRRYVVWTSRTQEPPQQEAFLDAKDDDDAIAQFAKYENNSALQWCQVDLYDIGTTDWGMVKYGDGRRVKTFRERQVEDYSL